jgi:hypothetical protein
MWDTETDAYQPEWMCLHQEECLKCGKVFRDSVPRDECPDREAGQSVYADAVREAAEVTEWHRQRPRRSRPVISGPQGYRRRRED